jgi:lysozyme family protein
MKYEGNYCWDKGDSGGPTKFGITCYDYAAYKHQKMNSMSAWAPKVRAMTLPEAEDIYITKYATKTRFYELNSGKDT